MHPAQRRELLQNRRAVKGRRRIEGTPEHELPIIDSMTLAEQIEAGLVRVAPSFGVSHEDDAEDAHSHD